MRPAGHANSLARADEQLHRFQLEGEEEILLLKGVGVRPTDYSLPIYLPSRTLSDSSF